MVPGRVLIDRLEYSLQILVYSTVGAHVYAVGRTFHNVSGIATSSSGV